jgi:hypothetical protein
MSITPIVIACVIVFVGIVVMVGVLLYKHFKITAIDYDENNEFLMRACHNSNVIIEGKMGSGKDLLMSHIAYLQGFHYANIRYNGNTEVRPLSDLSLGDNTFDDFVNDNIRKIPPTFEEHTLFLVSDAGIYFPSQYDKLLDKLYPSAPLFAALCRQLYEMRVIYNTQNVERLWKKLREQCDEFFHVVGHRKYEDYILVKTIYYSNYEQCKNGVLPEDNKKHYDCKYVYFKVYKNELEYDTRAFKSKCLECDNENSYERLLKGLYNEKYTEVLKNV